MTWDVSHSPSLIQLYRSLVTTKRRERDAVCSQLLKSVHDCPLQNLCPKAMPPPLLDQSDAHRQVPVFTIGFVESQAPHPAVIIIAGPSHRVYIVVRM
jgi:hypothetical protein